MFQQSHRLLLVFTFFLCSMHIEAWAQETAPTPHPDEPKAVELLESIAERVPNLRSSGNRVFASCAVADLLWERDQKQARALFENVIKDLSASMGSLDFSDQESFNVLSYLQQQRQRTLEIVARRDPELALTFLQSTRPAFSSDKWGGQFAEQERNLELNLASLVAGRDPELALKLARASLRRGLSHNHIAVVTQLNQKHPGAAQVLYGEIVERFASDDSAPNLESFNAAWNLVSSFQPPQAKEEVFRRLIDTLISRIVAINPTDPGRLQFSQNLYHNIRWGVQLVEKFAPTRAQALRDWTRLAERTIDPNTRVYTEINEISQHGTVEDILSLHSKYPEELHFAINQHAVWKAVNDGHDRARQLAKELITDPVQRQQMLTQIDNHLAWRATNDNQIADARRLITNIKQVDQRIQMMTQLASNLAAKGNNEAALDLLHEARSFLEMAPQSGQKINAQLTLIRSFCLMQPEDAQTMLQPFIARLNEMIAAAVVLDGFDNRYLQEGEWAALGYYTLNGLITNVDQALGELAARDFEVAGTLAEQFERPEIRLMAQLAIVQAVLGNKNQNVKMQNIRIGTGRRVMILHDDQRSASFLSSP